MKILFTLFLVLYTFLSSAQNNTDSLSYILYDELQDTSILSEALVNTHLPNELKNAPIYFNENIKLDFEKELIAIQKQSRNLLLYLLMIFSLAIAVIWYFFKKREKQILLKEGKLLDEIESLKKRLSVQSVSFPVHDKKEFSLNKNKLEKAINSRLGESSWIILNLIFKNPSISNKEIAKEVSLSLEGVSSSLRRMYQAFEISNSSNKKITLIMKATRLSFES
ncbi:MAG: winged helix-turn-helix domain-containing protein [Saprospiraceae bacterium]